MDGNGLKSNRPSVHFGDCVVSVSKIILNKFPARLLLRPKKIIQNVKKKITGSIIGPAMGGPRNFVPINAPGMGRFQLFDLLCYSKLMIRVWVRNWDRVRVTVRVIVVVRLRVSKELGSGYVQCLIWGLGLDNR